MIPGDLAIRRHGLWQPKVAEPFQIILSGHPDTSVKVAPDFVNIFDLDLFNTPASTIKYLRDNGKKVICYFSAGSSEDWRPDYKQFQKNEMGQRVSKDDAGSSFWEGEKWLNIKNSNPNSNQLPNVWKIMQSRIKLAYEKGCNAIDPDNTDAYDNKNGLGLTSKDAVQYVRFMAKEAARYNMSTGLKNSGSILGQVQDVIQFAVNEECAAMNECTEYKTFLRSKPVFHIEYTKTKSAGSAELAPSGGQAAQGGARGGGFGGNGGKANKGSGGGLGALFGFGGGKKNGKSNVVLTPRAVELETAETAAFQKFCTPSNAPDLGPKFSTVIKIEALDGWVRFCDGRVVTTRISNFDFPKGKQSEEEDRGSRGGGGFSLGKGNNKGGGRGGKD